MVEILKNIKMSEEGQDNLEIEQLRREASGFGTNREVVKNQIDTNYDPVLDAPNMPPEEEERIQRDIVTKELNREGPLDEASKIQTRLKKTREYLEAHAGEPIDEFFKQMDMVVVGTNPNGDTIIRNKAGDVYISNEKGRLTLYRDATSKYYTRGGASDPLIEKLLNS